MKCETAQGMFDEKFHQTLTKERSEVLDLHLGECVGCSSEYEEHADYLKLMAGQKQSAVLTDSEVETLISKAISARVPPTDNGFWKGFAAASILAIGLSGLFYATQPQAPSVLTLVNTQVIDTEVTLIIDSPEDIYNADFRIELPDRMALQGYDEFDELNWVLDFSKGSNAIRLPVQIAAGRDLSEPLSIKAVIDNGSTQRTFELNVDLVTMAGTAS